MPFSIGGKQRKMINYTIGYNLKSRSFIMQDSSNKSITLFFLSYFCHNR